MDEKLYLNKDAAKIAGCTERQAQSWADKGLITPVREATGGGSKRGYDYINLIELGLCNCLINGMVRGSIQLVKGIMSELRERGIIRRWAHDPASYFKEEWEQLGYNFKEPPTGDPKDSERWKMLYAHFHKFFLKGTIKAEKGSGFLFAFFGSKIREKYFIFPDFYDYESIESFTAMEIFYGNLTLFDGALFVNIGKVKRDIDQALIDQ